MSPKTRSPAWCAAPAMCWRRRRCWRRSKRGWRNGGRRDEAGNTHLQIARCTPVLLLAAGAAKGARRAPLQAFRMRLRAVAGGPELMSLSRPLTWTLTMLLLAVAALGLSRLGAANPVVGVAARVLDPIAGGIHAVTSPVADFVTNVGD